MGRIWSIEGNRQRLDGGAMFGNAPRALWQRWACPDARGRIPLACRCLLYENGGRFALFEAGIGAFFSPELRERYGVEDGGHRLIDELARVGVPHDRIDVVALSHLHFDHAGGLLAPYREGAAPALLFPRAELVVSREALARAENPHERDRASFIPELPQLLRDSGRLRIIDRGGEIAALPEVRLHFSDGHTPGLMLSEIPAAGGPIVFAADLVPGAPWVHAPITMGYDRFPEKLIDEKRALLSDLSAKSGRLFFTHDPEVALARIAKDPRGRFSAADPVALVAAMAV